jgi:L-ribulose-5-phosphate 4-epimerase
MSAISDLKEVAWKCNLELPRHGLVFQSFGNASAIDRASGLVAIKPSGVPYTELRAEDIVVVDLQNNVVEGKFRPSTDTRTHTVLYRNFPAIAGVVHTHSTYAVSWAQAMKPIPIIGTTHADHLAFDIPCTEVMDDSVIAGDYEEGTGKQIVKRFSTLSYSDVPMVIVACHGPFTWGETPWKAVYNAVLIEELARMALLTLLVNPDTPRLKQSMIDKHYRRKHGTDSYYGQNE